MRTTLDLDDGLLAEAKALAARERLTLTRLIEEGLALRLRRATGVAAATACPVLPVHAGRGGLTAAVADPRRNSALLDAADVNVLVAASRSDHPHHPVALHWLEEALAACSLGQRLAVLPMVAAQEFLGALLAVDGVQLMALSGEWPLLEPLCREHQLVGNAISAGWIAAAVLARRECLVTFDRDFVPLLPSRQLLLLEG
ncbi:hypothetical protein NZK32_07620 [Cyanobium sp. FGCU-52]|nr:hypothetical protein [Cyanobium sp. FGCU52]